MVMSFSAVYLAVDTVLRFRVGMALLVSVGEIKGEITSVYIIAMTGLITSCKVLIASTLCSRLTKHLWSYFWHSEDGLFTFGRTKLASPVESEMAIIWRGFWVSPAEAHKPCATEVDHKCKMYYFLVNSATLNHKFIWRFTATKLT